MSYIRMPKGFCTALCFSLWQYISCWGVERAMESLKLFTFRNEVSKKSKKSNFDNLDISGFFKLSIKSLNFFYIFIFFLNKFSCIFFYKLGCFSSNAQMELQILLLILGLRLTLVGAVKKIIDVNLI